jgi:catechol 2,3-dioxygenase-like lactoylglutathione lyase family enzyme
MSKMKEAGILSSGTIMGFVPTSDAARARSFYEDVLGLPFVKDDGFAMVFEANGNMIRIARANDFKPAPFTILGWKVDDIRSTVTRLIENGVAFERYEFLEQDEQGCWRSPNEATVAWFKDPDGNVLSLTQFDK